MTLQGSCEALWGMSNIPARDPRPVHLLRKVSAYRLFQAESHGVRAHFQASWKNLQLPGVLGFPWVTDREYGAGGFPSTHSRQCSGSQSPRRDSRANKGPRPPLLEQKAFCGCASGAEGAGLRLEPSPTLAGTRAPRPSPCPCSVRDRRLPGVLNTSPGPGRKPS